ncbi:MAG: alpha/beta hydrolase [Lachnospiraceae bacterium]|nr:alpha/beta hydrolase [Lachnospiraceae bacterium]
MPAQLMKTFRLDLWKPEEYTYEAAYGFMPNIHAYLHDEDDSVRKCMLMVPGGGYCMLAPHEGELPALEYYKMGLNVFVLTYTNDITMCVPLKKQPMNDISRAVRLIRKNAPKYMIDPTKLIICGFSAGGHVCGSLCVHYNDIIDPDPAINVFSNRPDAVILCYPVLTSGKFTHIYSMQALLGKNPDADELDYYSCEKHVTKNTPPCFLWQTEEDSVVPVENTYLFANALRENGVPFAHYVFPKGGHGLSVASYEQFAGWRGGEYVCEQLGLALEHIKNGTEVNMNKERHEELMDQFFAPKENTNEQFKSDDASRLEKARETADYFADVHMWLELSRIWFERVLN